LLAEPLMPTNIRTEAIREVNIAIKLGNIETTYAAAVVGMHVNWDSPKGVTGSFRSDYAK